MRRSDHEEQSYDGKTALKNTRWEAFCQHYTGDFRRNAAGAYKAAGYHPKDDHVASVMAQQIMANNSIVKRVEFLDREALSRIRMTAVDAQQRLGAIVSARYSDFLDECGDVDISKVRDPRLAPAVESCDAVYDKDGVRIGWRLRLHDPKKALELLGLTVQREEQAQTQQVLVIKA